jgi:molybdenum cofactor guanylyltransferase
LGGIHAALRAAQTDLNLMLAVDTPFVPRTFLQYLLDEARKAPTALVVVPLADGRRQTLSAVYRPNFADAAEKALGAGKNRIDLFFNTIPVRVIDQEELQRAGFSPAIFRNLNTRADLEAAILADEEVHP